MVIKSSALRLRISFHLSNDSYHTQKNRDKTNTCTAITQPPEFPRQDFIKIRDLISLTQVLALPSRNSMESDNHDHISFLDWNISFYFV
jgi:hypothetical protein